MWYECTRIIIIKRFLFLYKSEHISLTTFQYLLDCKMFIQANPDITYNDIILLTDSLWELVDLSLLRLNHSLLQTSIL